MTFMNSVYAYFVLIIIKIISYSQILTSYFIRLLKILWGWAVLPFLKLRELLSSSWSHLKTLMREHKILTIIVVTIVSLLLLIIATIYTRINYLQHTSLAIVYASDLILVSVGLTLTTRVGKFANFAHAEFVVVGAYTAVAIKEVAAAAGQTAPWYQWVFTEMLFTFLVAGLIGILSELLVFAPLARRNATPLSLMVASIGLGMVIRQTIQEIFSAIPVTIAPTYPAFFDNLGSIPILGILFAPQSKFAIGTKDLLISRNEVWSVVIMVLTVMVLRYLFTHTTLGISMRATSDDEELAQITGINTQFVMYATWFIAAGVTGMGALFLFSAAQVQPGSGFVQLLLIFAVVTLGGFDSFEGTLISGFIISGTMTFATILNSNLGRLERTSDSKFLDALIFWNTGGDWKIVAPFVIIIIVLLFRPRGIFGVTDPKSKL